MATLTDQLQSLLGGEQGEQLSSRLGIDSGTLMTVAQTALPLLIGGLSHNTRDQQGTESLYNAVSEDHDGSILDNLGALFGGGGAPTPSALNGAGILGHIFGRRTEDVEQEVGRSTGVSVGTVSQVLIALAPLVMGWLARRRQQENLDPPGLGQVVQQEHARNQEQDTGGLLGRFSDLLDRNNDGNVMDDVMRMGGSILGGRKQ